MLVRDASELVGNTPLVEVSRFAKEYGVKARVLVKAFLMLSGRRYC